METDDHCQSFVVPPQLSILFASFIDIEIAAFIRFPFVDDSESIIQSYYDRKRDTPRTTVTSVACLTYILANHEKARARFRQPVL